MTRKYRLKLVRDPWYHGIDVNDFMAFVVLVGLTLGALLVIAATSQ